MDPNATIAEIRKLSTSLLQDDLDDRQREIMADHLAELTLALDRWLCDGGFMPTDWVLAAVAKHGKFQE